MKHFIGPSAAFITVLIIPLVSGCGIDPRITNQGGGNVLSAVTKLQSDQLSELTPDEMQILADTISQLSPDIDVILTDDQAAAVTGFLGVNEINSFTQAEDLINTALTNPDAIVIPDGFVQQLESINVDIAALSNLDLGSLDFANLFHPVPS